jgi:hypothetical protein
MDVDINTNSRDERTRDCLLDDESYEDSLFVGQRPSSRGNGIGNGKGKDFQ